MTNTSIKNAFARMWAHVMTKLGEKADKVYVDTAIAAKSVDWNQNDETANDYIKNRPFYSNGLNLATLVDNVTIEEMEITDNGISVIENPFELVLIEGNNYIVTWNGVDYNVTCSLLEDTLFIGNASIWELGEDTGEPFLIGVYDNFVEYIVSISSITSAPITISIQGDIEDIQKIDSKYLPPIIGRPGSVKASEIFNDYVNNIASGVYSHAEGTNTTASGWHSHAEGAGTTASGEEAHAEGCRTIASGGTSHAEGLESTASGSESHAEGLFTTASGWCSHSEGHSTLASGEHSHAEGEETIAASEHQHVQGKYNIEDVNNKYAHIVGNGNYNKRSNAHTLDWDGNAWFKGTIKIGGTDQDNASAVEVVTTTHLSEKMDKTNPTGTGSFSLNRKPNTTIGFNSFAEGNYTVASGKCSHAEGYYARAEGSDTHAEGHHAKAIGKISHAEGEYTIAASEHQHVQGKYNIEDNSNIYAHIVGNGTTESKRSNVHTLDWEGNAWFSGDVYIGSTSGTNKDEGSKKLVTENYVTENYYTKAEVEALIAQAVTAAIAASY